MPEQSNFDFIPTEGLTLDRENPRLPSKYKGSDDVEVLNWMLTDAGLTDLMASIAENGFFAGEPLIVVPSDNKFVVIEGNRRLAAVLLLRDPSKARVLTKTVEDLAKIASEKQHIPEKLPTFIVENRDAVQNYLAFRHISGVKQWPVISKARFLNNLYYSVGGDSRPSFKDLAKEIGSKASYVKRLLTGFRAFERIREHSYFGISELDEESFDLALITDAVTKNSNIARYLGIDLDKDDPFANLSEERLKEVTRWLYERNESGKTALGESRRLIILNRVLANAAATEAFRNGMLLIEAQDLTGTNESAFGTYLQRASSSLSDAQKMSLKIKTFVSSDVAKVATIGQLAAKLESDVRSKVLD